MSRPEGNSPNLGEWVPTFISNCCKCVQGGWGWRRHVALTWNNANNEHRLTKLLTRYTQKENFYLTYRTNVQCVIRLFLYRPLLQLSVSETSKVPRYSFSTVKKKFVKRGWVSTNRIPLLSVRLLVVTSTQNYTFNTVPMCESDQLLTWRVFV
jgi:hypothetical protein